LISLNTFISNHQFDLYSNVIKCHLTHLIRKFHFLRASTAAWFLHKFEKPNKRKLPIINNFQRIEHTGKVLSLHFGSVTQPEMNIRQAQQKNLNFSSGAMAKPQSTLNLQLCVFVSIFIAIFVLILLILRFKLKQNH